MKEQGNGIKKWLIRALVVIIVSFILVRLYFRVTDDFRLSNIVYETPYRSEWQTPPLSADENEKLNYVLGQEFTYLGKGAQCYAFVSQDQQYVLKFFKFKHLKPSFFVDMLPPIFPFKEFKKNLAIRKKRKLLDVFEGYRVAYNLHKEESGLLFMQLNIINNPKRKVTLRDKLGFRRLIDLKNLVFILQKKGQTLRTVMTNLLSKGDHETAKRRIGQIFDLYASEYRKGIYDRDHGVMHNTGFVGEQPFHLDAGKMTKEDAMKLPKISKQDIEIVATKIHTWLNKNYPKHQTAISKYIEEKVSALYGDSSLKN